MSDVRVKHCGITSVADAELCVDAGAWALGMILWKGSKRACTVEEAGRIASTMRRRVELAGVFVNAPLQRVLELTDALGLTIVQSIIALHGGTIEVSSALGEGTTVTVRLPREAVRAEGKAVPAA